MRIASILLTLVVVLGFVSGAGAQVMNVTPRIIIIEEPVVDLTINVGGWRFGFFEEESLLENRLVTELHAGLFGHYEVRINAIQGLVGYCFILAMLIILPAVLTVRWKRKQV